MRTYQIGIVCANCGHAFVACIEFGVTVEEAACECPGCGCKKCYPRGGGSVWADDVTAPVDAGRPA